MCPHSARLAAVASRSPPAHWLPRADSGNSRGDLLRRSFEDRLETRDDGATAADRLERLRLAELERQAALAALGDLPDEIRGVIAGVLALPSDAQIALGELL